MRLGVHALLAISVAACGTFGSIGDALFVRPSRIKGVGDLYTVAGLSWPLSQDRVEFWTRASDFAPLAYFEHGPQRAKIGDRPFLLETVRASNGLLALLRPALLAGRPFLSSDYESDSPPVALISSTFANRAFPSPQNAVGATLILLGQKWRIVGVTASAATYKNEVDVWLPRSAQGLDLSRPSVFRSDEWIGRLHEGTTSSEAHQQLVKLQTELAAGAVGTNVRFDGVIIVRPLLADIAVRRGHAIALALGMLISICVMVLSLHRVLAGNRLVTTSGGVERRRPSQYVWSTRRSLHAANSTLPAIVTGGLLAWSLETEALKSWLGTMFPPSFGTIETTSSVWPALFTAVAAIMLGVAMLGCAAWGTDRALLRVD